MNAMPMIPLYKTAAALISGSGLATVCAPFTGGMGVIFTLHHVQPTRPRRGFQPNHHLSVTPEFLDDALTRVKQRGFDIVTLNEAVKRLKAGRAERPFCAFTFDDGYRDNIEYALPVFRKHSAPMTVFVCTGVIDGTAVLWWEILEAVLGKTDRVRFDAGGEILELDSAGPAAKCEAARVIEMHFRGLADEDEARAQIVRFAEAYDVDAAAICRSLGADWDMLRKAARDPLLHIGAHTINHPLLSRLSPDAARSEIVQSRERIEAELSVHVEHFAYPYGFSQACGAREFEMLSHLGFKSAVTTRPGVLVPAHGAAPWSLPRASLNGHYQNRAMVDSLLSGVPFFLANGFRRVPAAS